MPALHRPSTSHHLLIVDWAGDRHGDRTFRTAVQHRADGDITAGATRMIRTPVVGTQKITRSDSADFAIAAQDVVVSVPPNSSTDQPYWFEAKSGKYMMLVSRDPEIVDGRPVPNSPSYSKAWSGRIASAPPAIAAVLAAVRRIDK